MKEKLDSLIHYSKLCSGLEQTTIKSDWRKSSQPQFWAYGPENLTCEQDIICTYSSSSLGSQDLGLEKFSKSSKFL